MEIVVERIAKKETYTIGRLYLLADGDELPQSGGTVSGAWSHL